MAHSVYLTVSFGTSKAGLLTVGYRLYDTAAVASGSRITAGVQDLLDGAYGALVSVPDGFRGRITWDTGEGTPAYASEGINPEVYENADVKTSSLTADIIAALVGNIAAVTPPPLITGDTVTVTRGDTIALPFTGLGNITGRSKLWLTVKESTEDEDADAVFQIEETGGLLVLNGAATTTTNGTTTIINQATGAVTFTLKPAASAALELNDGLAYDVQVLIAGVVSTLTQGDFVVSRDITRATA